MASVALTVFPRLQSVPILPVRQSNILLEPTTPFEPNVVRLERRCGSANSSKDQDLMRMPDHQSAHEVVSVASALRMV
jgi:hypothetical protein